jgi:DNA-binding CsgD family transcriptional regulator
VSDEAVVLANRGAVRGFTDNLNAALTDSEQSMRIGGDLGIPIVGALAAANVARIRAARGEDESAQSALAAVAQLPGAVPRVTAIAAWAEGVVSLNGGRNLHAQAALAKTLEHPPVGLWAGADIADAAARAGDFDQLRQWLELATTSVRAERSNRLWICVLRARALLSGGHAAGEYLEQALCRKDAGATLEYARCQLAFGEWLRRERRIIEARRHLSVALKTFERNAAAPLAQRARAELRAAGVADNASLAREETSSALSAQELLVAQLAAEGLTNKEIADQVYLSHRTVGAYLHSAFTTLGISRRSQLATALRPAREVLP